MTIWMETWRGAVSSLKLDEGVIIFLEVQTHGKICDLGWFQFLILNIVTYVCHLIQVRLLINI